ncbi:MAG: HNH endonuclease signature motif containing protein, partial [Aeromicrobium sp.]
RESAARNEPRPPGMVPAFLCDMDHREPWPNGPTTGDNLGPLCRRHHGYKGHGILNWSTLPPERPTPIVVEVYRDPINVEYAGQTRRT